MSERISNEAVWDICSHTEIIRNNYVRVANLAVKFEEVPDCSMQELGQDRQSLDRSIDALSSRLYSAFYIGRQTEPPVHKQMDQKPSSSADEFEIADFIEQLKDANGRSENWDHGWEIYYLGTDGRVCVKRGDQSRIAWAGTYLLESWQGAGAKIGDRVKLKVFPFIEAPLDSFFHTFGKTLSDQFDDYQMLRFYFNIKRQSAVPLLRFIAQQFNHYAVPYHFKTLADRAVYDRADAAVLYVASRYYSIVASILADLPALLGDGLKSGVPMFTKIWSPGIGVAHDPGNGASFGLHRCRLLASALFDAWLQQKNNEQEKYAFVEKYFDDAGLKLQAPYLNPGQFDIFEQPFFLGGLCR